MSHKMVQHKIQVKTASVKCEFCQKVMKRGSLKEHMVIHNNEKNAECNLCYKKFLTVRYMQNHQTEIHRKEKMLDKSSLYLSTYINHLPWHI